MNQCRQTQTNFCPSLNKGTGCLVQTPISVAGLICSQTLIRSAQLFRIPVKTLSDTNDSVSQYVKVGQSRSKNVRGLSIEIIRSKDVKGG